MVEVAESTARDEFVSHLGKDDLSTEEIVNLRQEVHASIKNRAGVEELVAEFSKYFKDKLSSDNKLQTREGTANWILGNSAEAAEILKDVRSTTESQFVLGQAYLELGNGEGALEQFESLDEKGDDPLSSLKVAEALSKAGRWEDALNRLGKLSKKQSESDPWFFYLTGFCQDMLGEYEAAIGSYDAALAIDEEYVPALFRKAYNLDLYGEDEQALELYEKLRWLRPLHVNTMMNLGLIYEDRGDYQKAIECYQAVLEFDPNHARANLYLKDAQSSLNMYYDEDLLRREAKLQSLLATPLSEFNLSVRVRHALNQFNIQTLGDLVQRSEEELLGLENFGKSSVKEIKELLTSKGLSLAGDKFATQGLQHFLDSPSLGGDQIYEKSVDDFEWSKRVRKGFETLNINLLGDLVSKTEKDFMECRNFGQTSIREIKKKLASLGLSLRTE